MKDPEQAVENDAISFLLLEATAAPDSEGAASTYHQHFPQK
jgi:hypothetical protein